MDLKQANELLAESRRHWAVIKTDRAELTRLYEQGQVLSLPRMIELSREITGYGQRMIECDCEYDDLLLKED